MMPNAWQDFADFMATGANVQNRPDRECADVLALAEVAQVFEDLQKRYEAGDRASLWEGISTMCRLNVPAPYWLSDALLQVDRDLHRSTQSAHALLGLDKPLPLSDARSRLARRKLQLGLRLWFEVQRQRRSNPGISKAKAIQAARAALRFPYQQRQASALFDEQDARQRAAASPYSGAKVKRLQR